MNIENFTEIVKQAETSEQVRLIHYKTDVVDYRFGRPEKYVAISFEKNAQSTVMEFRIGFTGGFIKKFNALTGVHASPHNTSPDMFVVRVENEHFNSDVEKLVIDCINRSVRKFKTAQQ